MRPGTAQPGTADVLHYEDHLVCAVSAATDRMGSVVIESRGQVRSQNAGADKTRDELELVCGEAIEESVNLRFQISIATSG